MKLKYQSAQSSFYFFFGIFACLFFDAFYFSLALPLSQIPDPPVFWASFSLWGIFGAYTILDAGNDGRKGRANFLKFGLILLLVFILSRFTDAMVPVAYSFAGFPAGIAIFEAIVLIIRGIGRIKRRSSSVQPIENNLKTPQSVTGLQKDLRYFFALSILTMIYSLIELYLGVFLDIHSYFYWIGFALWMLVFASCYWIIIKYSKRTKSRT